MKPSCIPPANHSSSPPSFFFLLSSPPHYESLPVAVLNKSNCGVLRKPLHLRHSPPRNKAKKAYLGQNRKEKFISNGEPTKRLQNPPLVADRPWRESQPWRLGWKIHASPSRRYLFFVFIPNLEFLALIFVFPSAQLSCKKKKGKMIPFRAKSVQWPEPKRWPNACVHVTVEQKSSAVRVLLPISICIDSQ